MTATTPPEVSFTIDGRTLRAPEGTFVLDVARDAGIEIPTLCNHPDLEPVGACRVCMVEVTHPDWKGWSGLMTACLYPVKEGIEVSTRSERVKSARRGVLSLLAARCPTSDIIQRLAADYGASAEGLTADPNADNCILCGLCTRVCETYATGAITTAGRGAVKRVATFADTPPDDCVGCGACAQVCPTGDLRAERNATSFRIWDRVFTTALCEVDETRCVGCGTCEEACPFSVARVALRAGGERVAVIATEFCRGCGVCVGACPSGAITQVGLETAKLTTPTSRSVHVFACGRSNLKKHPDPSVHVTEMPCAGRVTVPLLLNAVASGTGGVLVLGRHQRTCRFDGAEDPVRERVRVAKDLLDLAGIEPGRIRFEEPAPGPHGPTDAVKSFQAAVAPWPETGLDAALTPEHEGLDTTVALFDRISSHPAARPETSTFLRRQDLPAPSDKGPVLLAGAVPLLHTLDTGLFNPLSFVDLLRAAIDVLAHFDVRGVGVDMTATRTGVLRYALEPTQGEGTVMLDAMLCERGARLARPPSPAKVAIDGSDAQRALVSALGYEAVDVGPDPLPPRFAMTSNERRQAEERLLAAERAGAPALLVDSPTAMARWATITRHGAWRTNRVLPILGVRLAQLAIQGRSLGLHTLLSPALHSPVATEVVS